MDLAAFELDHHPDVLVGLEALRQFLLHRGAAGAAGQAGAIGHRVLSSQSRARAVRVRRRARAWPRTTRRSASSAVSLARGFGSIALAFSARGGGANTRLTTVGEPRRPHFCKSSMPAAAALHVTISARAARKASPKAPRRISAEPSSMVTRQGSAERNTCVPPSARRSRSIVRAAASRPAILEI